MKNARAANGRLRFRIPLFTYVNFFVPFFQFYSLLFLQIFIYFSCVYVQNHMKLSFTPCFVDGNTL
ncbi:hypothetical protein ANACOL_03713 [Anaerotruncus colihominis DSM 17241]|uniref:Uncharacterized protein n=1 Tax=Anaerotruncus colihominis DSM 17241 TaxID=445972 RepID=B0PFY1_9FIRM|nr:hypothetical protein ANACOL_03713 [Anaerotruncus colihominis DSM 17241]